MQSFALIADPRRDRSPDRAPLPPNLVAEPPAEERLPDREREAQLMVLIARAERACGTLFDHLGLIAGE